MPTSASRKLSGIPVAVPAYYGREVLVCPVCGFDYVHPTALECISPGT